MNNQRHIIESQQFDAKSILKLFRLADHLKDLNHSDFLKRKIVATLFYAPSTRTRLSFEAAVLKLGGGVISTENAKEFSSAAKGETIEDTIMVIGNYADAIVLRHYEVGSAKRAAKVSTVPIINAGDGVGQHPTQALLDAYTIYKQFGRVDNISVQFIGDLANGRTVRSLVYLLSKFPNNRFVFVSPKVLRMRDDILDYLNKHQISFYETEEIQTDCDANYATRIQKEYFGDNIEVFNLVFGKYIIDNEIADSFPEDSIIMHPLPRVNEILPEVDNNHRARYFQQVENGLLIRMALLRQIFDERPFLFDTQGKKS